MIIIIIIIIINTLKEISLKLHKEHCFEDVPKSVETSHLQVRTDKTILNTKPDFLICDNEKGTRILRHFRLRTCRLIDAGISGDRYVIKKEAEKIPCYKTLQ